MTRGKRIAVLSIVGMFVAGATGAQVVLGDWFSRRDANGDGFLTRGEWSDAREQRLRRIDADGDGGISRDEFLAFERARAERRADRLFGRLDADGDGRISHAERQQALGERFRVIDGDGDGRVSRAELRRARLRMRAGNDGD